MAIFKAPTHLCWICGNEVRLEACKTDEHGLAVHEECYVLTLRLKTMALRRSKENLRASQERMEQTDELLRQSGARQIGNSRDRQATNPAKP